MSNEPSSSASQPSPRLPEFSVPVQISHLPTLFDRSGKKYFLVREDIPAGKGHVDTRVFCELQKLVRVFDGAEFELPGVWSWPSCVTRMSTH